MLQQLILQRNEYYIYPMTQLFVKFKFVNQENRKTNVIEMPQPPTTPKPTGLTAEQEKTWFALESQVIHTIAIMRKPALSILTDGRLPIQSHEA